MKRATAIPGSTWFCSKNSHWCTRARSSRSAGQERRALGEVAAGSPPDSGISSPRVELEHRHAPVGVAREVLGLPRLAAEQVDGHGLERRARAAAAGSAPSGSSPTPGGRRGSQDAPEERDGLGERQRRSPRGRSAARCRARTRARRRTRSSVKRRAAPRAPSRTASRPSAGVCGSRAPKISRSSPSISPARASESVGSLPSLPSCSPVGYQHAVPRTRGSRTPRGTRGARRCSARPRRPTGSAPPATSSAAAMSSSNSGTWRRVGVRLPAHLARVVEPEHGARPARRGGRSRARRPRTRSPASRTAQRRLGSVSWKMSV